MKEMKALVIQLVFSRGWDEIIAEKYLIFLTFNVSCGTFFYDIISSFGDPLKDCK